VKQLLSLLNTGYATAYSHENKKASSAETSSGWEVRHDSRHVENAWELMYCCCNRSGKRIFITQRWETNTYREVQKCKPKVSWHYNFARLWKFFNSVIDTLSSKCATKWKNQSYLKCFTWLHLPMEYCS